LLVLIAVLAVAGWTGLPQTMGVRVVLERVLGARVEIDGVSLLGKVTIDALRLYEPGTDAAAIRPTIEITGLVLDYSLLPERGRFVETLEADHLAVALDQTQPGQSNFRFLTAFLAQPPSEHPMRFVPKRVIIADLDVDLAAQPVFRMDDETPPPLGLTLKNLRLGARIRRLGKFKITLDGEGVQS